LRGISASGQHAIHQEICGTSNRAATQASRPSNDAAANSRSSSHPTCRSPAKSKRAIAEHPAEAVHASVVSLRRLVQVQSFVDCVSAHAVPPTLKSPISVIVGGRKSIRKKDINPAWGEATG